MGSNCLTKRQKRKAFVSHKGLNVISSVFFPTSFQKTSQTFFISFDVVLFMLLLHAFAERKCSKYVFRFRFEARRCFFTRKLLNRVKFKSSLVTLTLSFREKYEK